MSAGQTASSDDRPHLSRLAIVTSTLCSLLPIVLLLYLTVINNFAATGLSRFGTVSAVQTMSLSLRHVVTDTVRRECHDAGAGAVHDVLVADSLLLAPGVSLLPADDDGIQLDCGANSSEALILSNAVLESRALRMLDSTVRQVQGARLAQALLVSGSTILYASESGMQLVGAPVSRVPSVLSPSWESVSPEVIEEASDALGRGSEVVFQDLVHGTHGVAVIFVPLITDSSDVYIVGLVDKADYSFDINGSKQAQVQYGSVVLLLMLLIGIVYGFVRARRKVAQHRAEIAAQVRKTEEQAEIVRAKTRFLSVMSHELRNALSGVILNVDLALSCQLDDEAFQFVTGIGRSTSVTLAILNDVLDLSKVEAGKVVLELRPISLRDVAEFVIQSVGPSAAAKQVDVVLDAADVLYTTVKGDSTRLRQILHNLLSNAVKFTHTGHVAVRVVEKPNGVYRVEVSDSGIGLTDEGKSRLFQEFSQADDSTTRQFSGTGLGLYICRKLLELMSGSIGAESEGPGRGSTFWFEATLPPCPQAELSPDMVLRERTLNAALLCAPDVLDSSLSIACITVTESQRLADALHGFVRHALGPLKNGSLKCSTTSELTPIVNLCSSSRHHAVFVFVDEWFISREADFAADLLDALQKTDATRVHRILLCDAKTRRQRLDLKAVGWAHTLVKPLHGASVAKLLNKRLSTGSNQNGSESGSSMNDPNSSNSDSERGASPTRTLSRKKKGVRTNSSPSSTLGNGESVTHAAAMAAKLQSAVDAPPPTIMIVDDFDLMRNLCESILVREGYRVITAVNGAEAVDLYEAEHDSVSIIFCDVEMPVMNGLDASRTIRRLEVDQGWTPVVIVAMTANALREDRTKCAESGMDDFLAKPVTKAALLQSIANALSLPSAARKSLRGGSRVGLKKSKSSKRSKQKKAGNAEESTPAPAVPVLIEPAAASPRSGTYSNVSILCVDDNALILMTVQRAIESILPGCRVSQATSAEVAKTTARAAPNFDYVLTDYSLGAHVASGADVIETLRDICPDTTQFVMCSGDASNGEIAEDLGVKFLLKPFTRAALQTIFDPILHKP